MNKANNDIAKVLTFTHPMFGNIRTALVDSEPWFVGKDVAAELWYSNSRDALTKRVDEEDKGVAKCDTLGGVQDMTIINESGLYCLIMSSKLPAAKAFKRWVTSEVLPAIRKTGKYELSDEIKAIVEEHKKFFTADTFVTVGEMAKILNKNGFNTGKTRLLEWLRANKLTMNDTDFHQVPMQESVNNGLMALIDSTKEKVSIMITPKGQRVILGMFEKEGQYARKTKSARKKAETPPAGGPITLRFNELGREKFERMRARNGTNNVA